MYQIRRKFNYILNPVLISGNIIILGRQIWNKIANSMQAVKLKTILKKSKRFVEFRKIKNFLNPRAQKMESKI